MDFSGKRVLVTGGAQGLGRAIVEKFHAAGARVVVMDKGAEALAKLKSDLPEVTTVLVDLTNWDATSIEMEKLEPLDHLINNAGVASFQMAPDITEQQVDFVFGVNFKAGLNMAQLFAKKVTADGVKGASIVNISSVLDRKVIPGALTYCCSKAAITMMTKCLAKELGPLGIRVNAVRPAAMSTQLFDPLSWKEADFESFAQNFISVAPIPRLLQPKETADLVIFLASSAAAMITGEDIAVDGGYSIA